MLNKLKCYFFGHKWGELRFIVLGYLQTYNYSLKTFREKDDARNLDYIKRICNRCGKREVL